ncbi:uncharacterized protein [Eurosta solidaginis]|uniref:uncharacterized protein n=1 Tax=Eurosta solidaginis TaxID=178769 RepID=UPI003530A30A
MGEYHYEGDCGINNLAMQLSSWTFSEFEIDELPNGYVKNDDFGPRVAKYDWFELLEKFAVWIAFLTIAGLAAVIGSFWLCSRIKGLHCCGQTKHRVCRCLVTLLLILLLLPLIAGLYLSSRANHLLRKYNNEQQHHGSLKTLDQNHLDDYKSIEGLTNTTFQDNYKNNMMDFLKELDRAVAKELIEWQQIMAQNEQTNFKQLKHLFANRLFYKNSTTILREISYELVKLGIEINDFLRDFMRIGINFLQSNMTIESKNTSNFYHAVEGLNVWHLSALNFHYKYTEECLNYLIEAYSNITKIKESIAKIKPKFAEFGNSQLMARHFRELTNKFHSNSDLQEKRCIQKYILFVAMAMVFVTAALIYMLFMALGFSIFNYYEEANFIIKCFNFLSCISITVLALLAVLHFLLTMVLHTGICHEFSSRSLVTTKAFSSTAIPLECLSVTSSNEFNFPAAEIQDNLLTNIKHEIPQNSISRLNITDYQFTVSDTLQEKWYESYVPVLLAIEDSAPYLAYVKQYYIAGIPEADIFLCKFNRIGHPVKKQLYTEKFVPNATLLYKTLNNINARAYSADSKSFGKILKYALNEVYKFEKIYAMTRANFFDTLNEKVNREFRRFFTELVTCLKDYQNQVPSMRSQDTDTKCGCLEDWLMIYAIGVALVVLSLFMSMILSMLLYKLNKRAPPVFMPMSQLSKINDCAEPMTACATSAAAGAASAPLTDTIHIDDQVPSKDCVVNIKGDE